MHFCQLHKIHPHPSLTIGGSIVPVVNEYKFLGLIFDSKLNFIPHIKYLKNRCHQALNLLRLVSHMDWGADRRVLLRLYKALVRSRLDYGCVVYGSARKSYLSMLDPIHNQGLRLSLGAFRTSPCNSLYVESNEPSLEQRRTKLSLQYTLKIISHPQNPAYDCIYNPHFIDKYDTKPKVIPPLGIRIRTHTDEMNIDLDIIAEITLSPVPPWLLSTPCVVLDMHGDKKSSIDPTTHLMTFKEMKNKLPAHFPIYTDGSRDGQAVAAAAVAGNNILKCRLPTVCSIFTAEARAILLALEYAVISTHKRFVVFSDSMSCLLAIRDMNLNNPIILQILLKQERLIALNKTVTFFWVPGHVGIRGNEQADRAAKAALSEPISRFKVPTHDFRYSIRTYTRDQWQRSWNQCVNNKLFDIKPVLGDWSSSHRRNRREEIVLSRIRIGHTHLTHSYLLKGEEMPWCIPCHTPLTVEHVMIRCGEFDHIRGRFFSAQSLRNMFDTVDVDKILGFTREANLFNLF